MLVLRVVVALAGVALVATTLSAAVRTVVVPRAEQVWLNRFLFRNVRKVFALFARDVHTYERRDRVMARFAPTALMLLPFAWAAGVIAGFTALFWGLDGGSVADAFVLSGSSMTTLGFEHPNQHPQLLLCVLEALVGLGLIALLISFLPTMYAAFSRREAIVAKLYMRAGDNAGNADPATFLIRQCRVNNLERLEPLWVEWEQWFTEIGESQVTFPALNWFRSPSSHRSWITGAGIALDSASLHLAVLDVPRDASAAVMVRAGFLALREIGDYFHLPYARDPAPDDPISIERSEFDAVVDLMAAEGVPIVADRDQAWRDFAGWRVNYDEVLLRLADTLFAPYQPWVSDRGPSPVARPGRLRAGMRRRSAADPTNGADR